MSTVSCRRFAANWTSAMEPTISSAQNESVRSVRAQLNSRGGGMRLAIRSGSRRTAGAGSFRRDRARTPRGTLAERRTRRTPARAREARPELADPARDRLLIEDDPLELTRARLLQARRAW